MDIKKFKQFEASLGGWVNVKIDNQIHLRMAKYVYAIDTLIGKSSDRYNLSKKIEILSNIDEEITNSNIDVRTKISIITLLQYLNELSKYFSATSSGFLLENFLATLIHGVPKRGTTPVDIESGLEVAARGLQGVKSVTYQIKLYTSPKIKINWTERCDYYVICLREQKDIDVYILSGDETKENYIGNFADLRKDGGIVRYKNIIKRTSPYIQLDKDFLPTGIEPHKLKISKVENLIKKCGEDLQSSISGIYNDISNLQYCVDALISGFDVDNKKKLEPDVAGSRALGAATGVRDKVEQLIGQFRKDQY